MVYSPDAFNACILLCEATEFVLSACLLLFDPPKSF